TANNFNALLAGSVTNNTTIENVNVTYKAIQWPYADSYAKNKMTGLLVTRWNNTAHTVSNVTLNAGALTVTNALGYELSTVTFENVKVLANEVTLIGCTTAYDNETNLTSWPTGVTYIDTLEEITDNNKYIAEAGAISLENANFEVGEIYDVTCGSATAQTVIAEAGKLTATISDMAVGTTVTVTCVTEGKSITFTNVFNVTKILRTADDLNVLNAANASGHITGYYVLGNNINCNGATFRSDARDGNKTFAGTFDGQGYTISNLKAGANGIFNLIVGGTVKNVNFTDVSLIKDNYHFTALLAGQTWGNTTIENVNVTYSAIEWPINNVLTSWAATGLLIARWSNATTVKVTNVTLDATGLNVTNALGTEITGVVFTNVTVKGDSYELIACTSADSSSGISEWPSGVTFTDTYVGVNVTLPSESDYYTFSGNSEAQVGSTYTFTVTEKVAGLNEFIVLVNGEEVTGNNGTYTVDVTGDLTIQVLHRYVESGSVASVTYNGDEIIVTNATSTSDANYMAYISSDYVNYLISLGYTKLQVYIAPDLTIANQAGVKCGENARTRTASNYTAVAEFDLTADNPIIFWCQKDGSGNAIQGQGGYMKITGLVYVKADGTTLSGMPTTVEVTTPSESDYYTFTGSSSAILNGNYTFTITEKVAGLNDFIVLINGNVVEGVNGVYTEENVTEALTIQVLHGYIEHGANVTVGYNGNKITLTNAVQGTYSEGNAPYMAYITADYINYMLAQGYNYISFDYSADNTIAYQACAGWKASDNKLFAYVIDGTTQTIVVDLSNLRDNILYFWGQNAGGSGGQIANQGAQVYVENLKFYKGKVSVTAPVDSDYYTFSGDANAYIGETYTFTVTEKVAGLNDFIVLINGNVVEGVNGVYTEENVSEALTIQVVHGYVEYGSVSSAEYIGNKLIITNSTSAGDANYMAYISADYVNYMMSKGYTNVHIYLQPDGEKADQAIVACGNTIVRTPSNYTSVADVTLVADTMIKFWCQKNGSGSSIQGQGGYMTITGIAYGGTESGMPTTVDVTMPSESDYYTFTGSSSAILNGNYTFTVTEKVSGLNNFIVLVNGVEVTGNSGTYTVENVTEALTIKVIHGYIEYGTTSTVTYDENGVATVTNSTSTNNEAFMAYISADYVNYLLSKGYNYIDFYITPDGTTADTALVMCGNTIGRTVENGGTSIARVQLKADTAIVFWCQKGSSGSTIQGQGGYMTVQFIAFRETA
ncbi:MAG: hypothetical protein IJW26_05350, partial [Clostridia bacterium]|nr:hypothetical protein [Clostridia bacterium]